MFVSFLMPHETRGLNIKARHLAVFYKQLGAFRRDEIAFVGTPEYFRDPAALEAEGRMEWHPATRLEFGYDPPVSLDGVRFQALPADLFERRLRRLRSPLKLFRAMLTERLGELEAEFASALDAWRAAHHVEAVMLFGNVRGVEHVAQVRGIPTVHNEVGPLRSPVYQPTAYWDLRGVNGHTDAARRFRAFRREAARGGVTLLTRRELLRTVRRTEAPEIPPSSEAPYRFGIALQVEDDSNLVAYSRGFAGLDLITMARHLAPHGEVLVRCHPKAMTREQGNMGVIDDSPDATDFVGKCQTIVTVNSGTALEALLLGRRVVVMGDSPFRIATDRALDMPRRRHEREQLLALNFLVFGYLVPYPLMFDAEYSRWRLSGPSELDIYRCHQRWYRDRLTREGHSVADTLGAATKLLDAVFRSSAAEPLVVFGAGGHTPSLIEQLRAWRLPVVGLFDNDAAKWGGQMSGLPVMAPAYRDGTTVVLSSLSHADSMAAHLSALGYPAGRILRLVPPD